MRYTHILLALLLSSMLSINFAVNAFDDGGIVFAQVQKPKSQPLATQKTAPVNPATPTAPRTTPTSPATPTTAPRKTTPVSPATPTPPQKTDGNRDAPTPSDGQISHVTTRPASGLWHTGTPVDVQWQWPGYTNRPVDVTLWSGTTRVAVIISKWIGQSVGWNVPYHLSPGPYKVRVESSNNNRNSSEAIVRIELCTLAVTSPKGADKFWAGSSTAQITWTFTGGNPGPLQLNLVPAGAGAGTLFAAYNIPYVSRQYSWQVAGNTIPGNYQIRITSMQNRVMTATSETFSIDKFGSVGIAVTGPNNTPIDGATVTVVVNGVARSATTKTNGQASFDSLPPGTHTFTATKSVYNQNVTAGTTVTLATGGTQSGVIKLDKFGSVGIVVADPNNAPIDGATVTVVVNGVARSATTKTNGQALFDFLPAGTYRFTATRSGYYPYGNADTTITLASGATQSGVIKLQRLKGTIIVTVKDGANPINHMHVVVGEPGPTELWSMQTSANGTMTFPSAPTGTWKVTAQTWNYNGYYPPPHYADATAYATVEPGATATVTLSLQRVGYATITVTDGTLPIYGANVYDNLGSPGPILPPLTTSTDATGKVTIEAKPGSHTLHVSANGYKSDVVSVTIPSGATVTRTVTLTKN